MQSKEQRQREFDKYYRDFGAFGQGMMKFNDDGSVKHIPILDIPIEKLKHNGEEVGVVVRGGEMEGEL